MKHLICCTLLAGILILTGCTGCGRVSTISGSQASSVTVLPGDVTLIIRSQSGPNKVLFKDKLYSVTFTDGLINVLDANKELVSNVKFPYNFTKAIVKNDTLYIFGSLDGIDYSVQTSDLVSWSDAVKSN